MLTTRRATGLRARPLEARPDLVRDRSARRQGARNRGRTDVGLVFIDKDESAYLPITARGDVRRDWAEAAAIWKATDNMWWDGPDDPNAGVICGIHC